MQSKLELYQLVAPLAGLGIWERDFKTGKTYWNKIIRDILCVDDQFEPSDYETSAFYKHPEKVDELVERSIASKQPEVAELELKTSAPQPQWVRVRVQATYDAQGECASIYGTLEDISLNVTLRKALEEREKRFSNAFDYAPIGMALVSLSGSWLKVNLSLCKLFGYTPKDFMNLTFQDLTHPDDLDEDLQLLNQLVDGEIESYRLEKRYFHANGNLIWAQLNVTLVRDGDMPLYFVSQIKDITERKKSMETIQNQNGRLLNFAHIVSHNLRSHASNIRMLANMAIEEIVPEEKEELMRLLDANSLNLMETLGHLNDVVKVHDQDRAKRLSINLSQEVQRVIKILNASIRQTNAVFDVKIPEQVTIDFDPAYLESVLLNIIGNCLKYKHPSRDPYIHITYERSEGRSLFAITDNGLGINLELHGHKLFGMYKTFHRHPDARGVGLFMVKNQIDAMGGKIWADSEVGKGTTFYIEFD